MFDPSQPIPMQVGEAWSDPTTELGTAINCLGATPLEGRLRCFNADVEATKPAFWRPIPVGTIRLSLTGGEGTAFPRVVGQKYRVAIAWLFLMALALLLVQFRATAQEPSTSAAPAASGVVASIPAPSASAESGETQESDAGLRRVLAGKRANALPSLAERPGVVVVVEVHGMIDYGLVPLVRRALAHGDAAVVVLDVDTFGGRVDAAVAIRDALLAAKVPTVAYVNRRAISAGALISLACDNIVFAPGGSMGAATPVQIEGGEAKPVSEKMVSYMRSEMRATAEAKGRDAALAEAMVDADVEIDKVISKGKLLTVTTEDALKLGLIAQVVPDRAPLIEKLGLQDRTVETLTLNWAEQIARFLTDPTVAGILMSVGLLALMIELYSPGVGLPGIIGVTFLTLFFAGHLVGNLAGWEEVLLFVVGITALAVEVFVTPGFGVLGTAGILLVVASLTLAMLDTSVVTAFRVGTLSRALWFVLIALTVALVALPLSIWALARAGRLSRDKRRRWLVLDATVAGTAAKVAPSEASTDALVGQTGIAVTALRPAGKAEIDARRYDVVSELKYVDAGNRIRVVDVEGTRIVVVDEGPDEDAEPRV